MLKTYLKHFKHLLPIVLFLIIVVPVLSWAATTEELRQRISSHNQEITKLEAEIAQYQKELKTAGTKASTLQAEINRLETTRKKFITDIALTEKKIATTNLTIDKIALDIEEKATRIKGNQTSISELIRQIREREQSSLVEVMVAYDQWSDFLSETDQLRLLQTSLDHNISNLESAKSDLERSRAESEAEHRELKDLRGTLVDQKSLTEKNRTQKDSLLTQTKSQQSNYQKLLADRLAQKKAAEAELFKLESELNLTVDKSLIPAAGKGILKWPLDEVTITQNFGRTSDSGRLYASGTHNGVDFRAPEGTPVKAALSGTITATGDTDLQKGCVSYGKWVLINHNNGLSTLYAHLSLIKAVKGQVVQTSELIGYSGNTGYSTGPHLHFTVYATQGLQVQLFSNSINCKNVIVPIADPKAYLDPLIYL